MSKAGSTKDKTKNPVPENAAERFMGMVWVMSDMCGMEAIPEVYHHIELLGEAVSRHLFETTHKISPQKKVHNDRKRFIAIFKNRYAQMIDVEYERTITATEGKLINQVNRALTKDGFTCDDFLAWLFDDFLVENPKFRPPTVKSICSQFILHSFIDGNKELKDARRRQSLDKKESNDLIQRARVLMRSGMSRDDDRKIKQTLHDFAERDIMMSEFRKVVVELSEKYRQK